MPSWVLLLSPDSLGAAAVEQQIRLAGYSPRRAPDVARAEVLLGQGERPAAIVVDVSASGDEGLAAIAGLGRGAAVVALTPDGEGSLARGAEKRGAHVVSRAEAEAGQLSTLLARVASGRS